MESDEVALVDIVREFLLAHQMLGQLFERHRHGGLRFEDVQELVGDSEASVLFRLKERCHAFFRDNASGDVAVTRGALFDLAVGSLFHEAMKLRENLYQLTVYAPKVRALQAGAGPDTARLFHEFEKILAAAAERLEEAFQESETLLEQTREQFRELLIAHRRNGLVARYLLENASLAETGLGEELDSLFGRVHGAAIEGYALAARSYLASGYFDEAHRALLEALERGPERTDLRSLAAFAEGMSAYLEGRYEHALARLESWLETAPSEGPDGALVELAYAAVSRLGQLVVDARDPRVGAHSTNLARRLSALLPAEKAPAA